MATEIHTSIEEIPDKLLVSYFQKGYFHSQAYTNFVAYSNNDFFVPFDLTNEREAISIPRSPFGSIFSRNGSSQGLNDFLNPVLSSLKQRGIRAINVHHPSTIYSSFVPQKQIIECGFDAVYSDINQHIELDEGWVDSIHNMQKRKLNSLVAEGFSFRKMHIEEFETAHKFISVCRQAQGLQINISWDHLNQLIDQLPDVYECFGVFREEKISALCIAVNATSNVAYYYLPATSPMFRDKSPMVLLLAGMVDYYRSKGFTYLDLGVSSHEGKPQETLKLFKERMGAIETAKPTFAKLI